MFKRLWLKIRELFARLRKTHPAEKRVSPNVYMNERILDVLRRVGISVGDVGKKGKDLSDVLKNFGGSVSPTQSRSGSHWGSKNHSKKASKTRHNMARESNRINRKRIKNWSH